MVYPFETTVVPTWRLRVVDEEGVPYARKRVRQSWKHYSLELEDGENMADGLTNEDGFVEFPERTVRLTTAGRISRTALTHILKVFHGSTGIHADVAAIGPQGYRSLEYVLDGPPPAQLVLPRNKKEP